jgi:hypothetical protein
VQPGVEVASFVQYVGSGSKQGVASYLLPTKKTASLESSRQSIDESGQAIEGMPSWFQVLGWGREAHSPCWPG